MESDACTIMTKSYGLGWSSSSVKLRRKCHETYKSKSAWTLPRAEFARHISTDILRKGDFAIRIPIVGKMS